MITPVRLNDVLDELVQPLDPIQTFLNAYTVCNNRREACYNLFRDETRTLDYGSKTQILLAALKNRSLGDKIRAAIESNDDDEILVAVISLLTASAIYISESHGNELSRYSQPYQSSDGFGGIPYWLSLDKAGPFGGRIPKPPRVSAEMQETLQNYHDPLLVTPGKLSEWTLMRIGVDRTLENFFSQRMRGGKFRVAVSPLSYKAEILGKSHWRRPPQPPWAFHVTSSGPPEQQLSALFDALALATLQRVAVLVLPELRMPPLLLEATKKFLRDQAVNEERGLLLVAAGSWHIDEDNRRYNRCVILNHCGDELWHHDKLREYVVTTQNVNDAKGFFERVGVREGGGSEDISRGLTLEFYDSVIGRLSTAICVGFFSPEVEPLIQASSANILLVPAMSSSVTALEDRARAVVLSQRAATFVANCGSMGATAKSFYRLPTKLDDRNFKQLEDGQPLLVFDLSNG